MSLTISVFSDVICPWCLIGKRRLERALDQLSIRNSTTVGEGKGYTDYPALAA